MVKFIFKRVIYLWSLLIGISFLSFILANIAPVDSAEAYVRRISKTADETMIEEYREKWGFNQPILKQYFQWLGNVQRLDFGNSYITRKPVTQEIVAVIPTTLRIAGLASVLILIMAIPLGILSAMYEKKLVDKLICGVSFFFISVPSYLSGLLCLLVFGLYLGWIPVIGHGHLGSIFFASFILALPMVGTLIRILRASLIENKSSEYVKYAQARGISKCKIMINHLLRNAAPNCIVMFGQNVGYLIAGTAIAETIFSAPGLGQYALNAVVNRDFPVINGYIVLMAFCFVLFNTLAEICGMLLNPELNREAYK